jgi:hypothetical protein
MYVNGMREISLPSNDLNSWHYFRSSITRQWYRDYSVLETRLMYSFKSVTLKTILQGTLWLHDTPRGTAEFMMDAKLKGIFQLISELILCL